MTRRRWLWAVGIGLGLIAVNRLPVGPGLLALVADLRAAGPQGVILFAGIYVLATLCFLPVWLLTAGAGYAWGLWGGLLVVSPVGLLSAAALFLLARALGRRWLRAARTPGRRLAALEALFATGGPKLILWLRLSPAFPFSLVNAAAGLSPLPLWSFLWSSWLGMLPGLAIYLRFGATAEHLQQLTGGGRAALAGLPAPLLIAGLLAVLAVTLQVMRLAARALRAPG